MDISTLRDETPGCDKLIHFNNAGCALSPQRVTQRVVDHLHAEQLAGGYEAAAAADAELEQFYQEMATLLGCAANEIAFVENATRAWNMAIHSIPWQKGDVVHVGQNEYVSNFLDLLNLQRRHGLELQLVPLGADGLIDLEKLTLQLGARSRAIILTHVASQCGDIQPAEAVGRLARQHGLWFLLDACQSAGQLQLDTERLGCDFLCGTGRKYLRGPRGTGFLFVRKARLAETSPVFVDLQAAAWTGAEVFELRDDARRFETFERHVAGQLGLKEAVAYCNALGMDSIEQRVRQLAARLRDQLGDSNRCRVLELSDNPSGIVTFQHASIDAVNLQQLLQQRGINSSVSRARNAQLDLQASGLGDVNRASVHYYNTDAEVDQLVRTLCEL